MFEIETLFQLVKVLLVFELIGQKTIHEKPLLKIRALIAISRRNEQSQAARLGQALIVSQEIEEPREKNPALTEIVR